MMPEINRILECLVEADLKMPRDNRRPFRITSKPQPNSPHYEVFHRGFAGQKMRIYRADLDELETQDLIRYTSEHRTQFDVTPKAREEYRAIKESFGRPLAEVEKAMNAYLDDDSFRQRFEGAYAKWAKASHALVSPEADALLTQIGHDCREAMQEFATALVEKFQPPNADEDKAHTISRIKAVLNLKQNDRSKSKHDFLEALIAYWGTVSDLVQRQEHGAIKEGQELTLEDARCVVFHTGIVMHELDRELQ